MCCVLVGSVAVRKVLTLTLGAQDDVSAIQTRLTIHGHPQVLEFTYIKYLVPSTPLQLLSFAVVCSTNSTTHK